MRTNDDEPLILRLSMPLPMASAALAASTTPTEALPAPPAPADAMAQPGPTSAPSAPAGNSAIDGTAAATAAVRALGSMAVAEVREIADSLNVASREVAFELLRGSTVYGRWSCTAADLNVPVNPETLLQLEERFGGVVPALSGLAARGAKSLSDRFPTLITHDLLDGLRQRLSSDPSLPQALSRSLSQALKTIDSAATAAPATTSSVAAADNGVRHAAEAVGPQRSPLWLDLAEPLGFLPLLPWESVLRPSVARPIHRLARKTVPGRAVKPAQDVLLVCTSASDKRTLEPKAAVSMCRHIIGTAGRGQRCVIHLFADFQHHAAVREALLASGLSVVDGGEPADGRGVVMVPLPPAEASTAAEASSSAKSPDHRTPTIWERPWAAWIKSSMAGRAVDVIHVVGETHFIDRQPTIEFSAEPWRSPEQVPRKWWQLSRSRVEFRHVDAALACDVATGLGAWAVVFSAPSGDTLRALRVLMHQLSGLLPGVLAVHDLVADPAAAYCADLYRFLGGRGMPAAADASAPEPPDHPAIVLQCDPAALRPQAAQTRLKAAYGDEFAAAVELVNTEMDRQGSIPAWAAVMQRCIEQSASTYLTDDPLTERDKAAQEGITNALTQAMGMLAGQMKSGR